jgi:hypothetical protein
MIVCRLTSHIDIGKIYSSLMGTAGPTLQMPFSGRPTSAAGGFQVIRIFILITLNSLILLPSRSLPSSIFPSGFPTNLLVCISHTSHMCYMPHHFIFLHVKTLTIFSEEYKLLIHYAAFTRILFPFP